METVKEVEKVLCDLREDLKGKIVVARHGEPGSEDVQYLLNEEGKARVFDDINEAKQTLLDNGYCEETIEQYLFRDAAEVYAINNNFEEEMQRVVDLGF